MQIAALTGAPAEAVDHVQEAFLRAWTHWTRVGTLEDPEGWVRRVAYNLAVSRWRQARRIVLGPPPDAALELDGAQLGVIAALRTLPKREREAIVLYHLVDLPVDAVAGELHAPVGTVKSWLSRGRARLAGALGDHDYRDEEVPQ